MRRSLVPGLAVVLVVPALTGCGLFGGSSSLDDALEVMPGTASRVIFFDRASAAERLDLEELDADPSDEELESYIDDTQELPYFTELDRSLIQMLETAPFSAQDVEWEVVGYESDGFGRVWRMNDDLDLDDVADELVDSGFEEESGEGRTLSIDLHDIAAEEQYLVAMQNITLLPDDHLIVTGPLANDVLDVINDDADSAVDTDAFEDLVDGTDDVEFADLARDDLACSFGTSRLAPEQQAASGIGELGHPEEVGFFVYGDEPEARSVLKFDSDEAAEDDAEAREEYLDEASSPVSGVPYSEFGDWEIEADGDQVRIDITYDDAKDVPAVVTRGDYLSVCAPD
jgi:hypothetical protein